MRIHSIEFVFDKRPCRTTFGGTRFDVTAHLEIRTYKPTGSDRIHSTMCHYLYNIITS